MLLLAYGIILNICLVSGAKKPSPWSHGRVAVKKEFPYIYGFYDIHRQVCICTAALVSSKKAIMTGSCFRDPDDFKLDIFRGDGYNRFGLINSDVNLNSSTKEPFGINPIAKHWYHCHYRYPNNRTMAFHDTGLVLLQYKQDGPVMKIPGSTHEDVKKAYNRLRSKGQMCKQAGWPTGRKDRTDANRLHVIYTVPMSFQECKDKIRNPVLHRLGYVCGKTHKPETGACPIDMHGAILDCGGILFGFRTTGVSSVCSHSYFVLVGDSIKTMGLEGNFEVKSYSQKLQANIKIGLLLAFLSKIKLLF